MAGFGVEVHEDVGNCGVGLVTRGDDVGMGLEGELGFAIAGFNGPDDCGGDRISGKSDVFRRRCWFWH